MQECVFCKIAKREIPADIVYEDEIVVGFRDIKPQAPVHILVIPRQHIPTWNDPIEEVLVPMWQAVQKIAKALEVSESGYRVVANCNRDGGQEVFHIHLHLLGKRPFQWPPG